MESMGPTVNYIRAAQGKFSPGCQETPCASAVRNQIGFFFRISQETKHTEYACVLLCCDKFYKYSIALS